MIDDKVEFRMSSNFNKSDQFACGEFSRIFNSKAIAVCLLKSFDFVIQLVPSVDRNTRSSVKRIHGDMSPWRWANICIPETPFLATCTKWMEMH